jgi:hypothetical protein
MIGRLKLIGDDPFHFPRCQRPALADPLGDPIAGSMPDRAPMRISGLRNDRVHFD